jgi:bacterioferritin-associated ferredoxin
MIYFFGVPMILCLCKGVSDRKVREMAQQGQTLKQIVEVCEAGTGCGACTMDLREIVRDESDKSKPTGIGMNTCS